MIRSMTSFARVSLTAGGKQWIVEIRSLNQRYFELSLRLPSSLFQFESQIRQLVQSVMRRGKVSLSIGEEGRDNGPTAYELDEAQVRAYLATAKRVRKKFSLEGDFSLEAVLRLPGVIKEKTQNDVSLWTWPKLEAMLKQVLKKAIVHKEEEGEKLESDFRRRLAHIAKTVQQVEKLIQGNGTAHFEKLKGRLRGLLGDEKIEEDRLYREVAFLAERSDISEEVVRMSSHLDLFGKWLSKQGEIGRELDFLCQEMNREANTMASKAQLFEVSKETIAIKSEIEKIREQVQNVE